MNNITGWLAGCAVALASNAAFAQSDTPPETALFVELNTLGVIETGCRLTFMATNALGRDIDKLVLETVLLTKDGKVNRLTLFDMRDLPANRPRVRQFDVPSLSCDALGSVLINGIETCSGGAMEPNECGRKLDLSTRTEVEIIG